MPRSFDLSVESSASVEQIHSAFSEEDYWLARLAAFGGIGRLDSLIIRTDGSPSPTCPTCATIGCRQSSLTTATAAEAEPGDTVTYNIDADGPLILVSYHDEMDNLQQLTNQLAPWSTSFTSEATYGLFAVGAKTSGERVSCEIIVNGEVRDQKSSNARHTLADCSALATDTPAPPDQL